MFSKTEEPLDADDWLQTMENNLEVAGVEAAEKVLFATHYLSGPPGAWWTSARAMNAGQMMTWADFKLKFSKYHVPQGLIKKMRDEFRELKQGRMSVVEYLDSAIQMEGKLHQANENRKCRIMNQNRPNNAQKHRNNSTGGFAPRYNKPPVSTYRPNYPTNNGGHPKPEGHNNNNNNHNNNSNPNNNNNHPNGNDNNPNTALRTGSNAVPVNPKD
ncbi:hypothetical protein QYE76_011436 [Lolium multiflorum]|uniref:Retrotransposon gag domain-containing protein n=1 Tax=Lolium multiflorum TaxID=4521 RepID=A0AAD8TZH7_LOLMU|nr:hypothetical protein QYE76_011436 [Lolium multiflorum]